MSKGPKSVRYAFGDCILDSDTRQVYRAGGAVHLGPKAYELLQVLISARPRVLSKIELFERLWPSTTVSESSLSTVVAELREALGDTAREARYVRTAYGFGYALVAKVTALVTGPELPVEAPTVACRLVWGARTIELPDGVHLIGRAPEALVTIDDPAVSRSHARLVVCEGVLTLEDLGSRNGTYRDGQRLSAVAVLADGDVIRIGPVRLQVSVTTSGGASTLVTSGLDATAHDPPSVDDEALPRHVAARR